MATQSDYSRYRAQSTASAALRSLADWLDAHPDVPTDGHRIIHVHTLVNGERSRGTIDDESQAIAVVERFARDYADGYVSDNDTTTSATATVPCGSATLQVIATAMHAPRGKRKVS